jgi:hypothetical protein
MEDLNSAIPVVEKNGIKGGQQQPRWIPPPPGMMKVNTDAAMSKNSTRAVLAAIARDASGTFLGVSAEVVERVSDPETAEVLAVQEGLALAKDLMGSGFSLQLIVPMWCRACEVLAWAFTVTLSGKSKKDCRA